MDKLERNIQRADEALRIVNSPLFSEAFAQVRESYLRAWESLPTILSDDAQSHTHDLHCRLKALNDIRKVLETHIQTGKLAQKELSGLERARAGAKRLIGSLANTSRNR